MVIKNIIITAVGVDINMNLTLDNSNGLFG